jgi:hypothetical protein
MNGDREGRIKNLSELPLPLLAALTLRAAMRYLPMVAISQDQNDAKPIGSVPKQVIAEPLQDTAKIFRTFHTCQVCLFVNWLASSSIDKETIFEATIANNPHHAAKFTHAAVLLAIHHMEGLPAILALAKATAAASGGATTAALSAAGEPTPRTLAEAAASAASAAVSVAEHPPHARELAAEIASLRLSDDERDATRLREQTVRLLSAPLWPRGIPPEVEVTWRRLRGEMLELNAGFELWIEWYQKRLQGVPLNITIEKTWATLSDAWLSLDPADINAYLQGLAKGEPKKEPPSALVAAAARKNEKMFGTKEPTGGLAGSQATGLLSLEQKYNLRLLPHTLWQSKKWCRATIEQFRPLAVPSLFFATYACISFISKSFGIPIHGAQGTSVFLTYEWLGTKIFTPIFTAVAFLIGFLGLVTPFWAKDLFFVYVRVTGSVWRALSTFSYGPVQRPSLLRPKDWRRLLAIGWASLLWPAHFLAFWRHWLEPIETYYNTNPPIFQQLKDGDIEGSSSAVMLALFIPHFAVNILTIVLLTCAYFAFNAHLTH